MTDEQRLRNLNVPEGPVDLVLDTDAYNEIDDQFAISLALRSKEKITLKALYAAPFLNHRSVSPEDGMERSYHEILKLLDLARETVPVFRGSRTYLPDETHPVLSDAAKDLADRAMNYTVEHPLYTVAIGAITNIASALLLRPEIAERIVVVWLGGHAPEWPHNHEFNCYQDVAAARVVFSSGAPLVVLPCFNVVSEFRTTGPELEYWLKGRGELAEYLWKNTVEEAESYASGKPWSRVIWDVTTIGFLLNDGDRFMSSRLIPTPIPEYDDRLAMDYRRPLCRYVTHIDRDALFEELFRKISLN